MRPIGTQGGKEMYFWSFCYRLELGFLNGDGIFMCVMNKPYELLEFALNSVYVNLQNNELYLTFTVVVPYVDTVVDVVAVAVMRLLLFVLHVRMLRE